MAANAVVLEDCRLLFRNFAGVEGRYNAKGDRNFCVPLSEDVAEDMKADGWNVKLLNPQDPEDEPQPYIQVKIGYKVRPPRIVIVTSRGKTSLGENEIGILDWAEIVKADLIIRPYEWEVGDKKGLSAYVQSLYVTIEEDALERKYGDVPDSAKSSLNYEELDDEDR